MIQIEEPAVLIRISQAYSKNMSQNDLYNYTRGQWRLSKKRAGNAVYGISVFKGKIVEVYKIFKWESAGSTMQRDNKLIDRQVNERITGRYEFVGELAEETTRNKYINKSVKHLFKQGNSNPIMYLNC